MWKVWCPPGIEMGGWYWWCVVPILILVFPSTHQVCRAEVWRTGREGPRKGISDGKWRNGCSQAGRRRHCVGWNGRASPSVFRWVFMVVASKRRVRECSRRRGIDDYRSRYEWARTWPWFGEPGAFKRVRIWWLQIYIVKQSWWGSGGVLSDLGGGGSSSGNRLVWHVKLKTIIEATDSNISVE